MKLNALPPAPRGDSVRHGSSGRSTRGRAFQPPSPGARARPRGSFLLPGCVGVGRTSRPSVLLWHPSWGSGGTNPKTEIKAAHRQLHGTCGVLVQTDGPMPAWGGEGASCPSCRRQCPSRGPMAQQHTRCLTHSDTQHRSLSPREAVISSFSEAWAFVRPGPGAETAKCRL